MVNYHHECIICFSLNRHIESSVVMFFESASQNLPPVHDGGSVSLSRPKTWSIGDTEGDLFQVLSVYCYIKGYECDFAFVLTK